MKEITKSNRGITLIALVVTIVVLLILAGVSIATLTGQNGILTQADKAKTETVKVGVQEKVQLEVQGSYDETRTINLDLLNNNLKNNIKGLTYKGTEISDTNKITSLPEIVEVDGYKIQITGSGTVGEVKQIADIKNGTPVSQNTVVMDSDNKQFTLPKGYSVKVDDTTNNVETVDLGIVVTDGTNEFVWVPVEDINSMAQCETAGGSCNLKLVNGHLKCTTEAHSATADSIVGKLYATTDGENFGTVNTSYQANSGFREPAIVTGNSIGTGSNYDNNTSYNNGLFTLDSLKSDYKAMAESVAKNRGFYIGRYETSLSSATDTSAGTSGTVQSKAGVIPTASDNIATYRWYGLYQIQKGLSNGDYVSSMIWGSQYDAMLNWVKNGTGADKSKIITENIGGNYSSDSVATTGNSSYSNDSINNIRDLGGNLKELTLEASEDWARVYRGCSYNAGSGWTISARYYANVVSNYVHGFDHAVEFGSRLTLYIL